MHLCQIKILYILVPNLGEIYLFDKKIDFLAKLRSIWRHGSREADLTVENGIFCVKIW